jgi:hypothetical protein
MTIPEPGAPAREGVGLFEGVGWAALAALTLATILLAAFRPTSAGQLVNEIRLAAGFDRYQAALSEGDRLHALAVAEVRRAGDDRARRESLYPYWEQAIQTYQTAREEAEGFHEDQVVQNRMAATYLAWARALYRDGTGPWYRPNERDVLRRARGLVDEGLALPAIETSRRALLEELGTRIDRAITPWPIL